MNGSKPIRNEAFFNLEQLCQSLFISKENCTCTNIGFISREVGNDICASSGGKVSMRDERAIYKSSFTATADILGVVGNMIVIIILSRRDMNLTKHNQLIRYLAMCDFFFASLSFLNIIPGFWNDDWIYGKIGCKLIPSAIQLGALIAIGMILLISIERFVGIVYPLKRLSNLATNSLFWTNIVLGISAVIPRVIILDFYKEDESCRETWSQPYHCAIYSWVIMAIYFLIPISIITWLYVKIFKSLSANFTSTYRGTSVHTDTLYKRRVKENRKVMVALVAVHIAFIIFTFPNKLRWVINDTTFAVTGKHSKQDIFYFISEAMYSFHTAVNPFIYTVANEKFRGVLVKTFKCNL